MTKDEALDLALEALEGATPKYTRQRKDQKTLGGALDYWKLEQHHRLRAITAIKQARALDKMADNARELGLDYEPVAPVREDWGPGPHECHSLTAAPVQELVAWGVHDQIALNKAIANYPAPAARSAPVQEPFAWCIESEDSADWCFAKTEEGVKSNSVLMDEDCIKTNPFPLYTTPPAAQRQWVGLTDEEILELLCIHSDEPEDWHYEMQEVRAIEQRLKEKNT